jgi:hypothetical protein
MYPDEKGENGANNKMVDAAGNQISALVQYVYPDNTSAYFIYPRYNVDDLFFTNVFFKPCIFDINKYAQRCNNR